LADHEGIELEDSVSAGCPMSEILTRASIPFGALIP
jgi:hypothetical protein